MSTLQEAVVEQFEQVVALVRSDGRDCEVDDDELELGEGGESFTERAVGMAERQFF